MAMPANYSALDLSGSFTLASPTSDITAPISLPGDVHNALLAASAIPDPYYGGTQGFDRVLDLLEEGCRRLLVRLRDYPPSA